MDKFWEFLKKNWLAVFGCVVAVLFAIVGVPLLINWAFSKPAWCDFFAVDWEAKDALAYYGSALGFIGTVIFSGLALWQNHVIKTESDKHTDLLEEMERKKNMPVLYFGLGGCWGNCEKLHFHIHNLSDNIALDIVISKISILNKDGTEFWSNNKEQSIHHLKDSKVEIRVENPPLTSLDQVFMFHVSYQDKFGGQHRCIVEGIQKGTRISVPRFYVKEIGEKS